MYNHSVDHQGPETGHRPRSAGGSAAGSTAVAVPTARYQPELETECVFNERAFRPSDCQKTFAIHRSWW